MKNNLLKKITLGGSLGRRFGKVHKLCVGSPAEAVRALMQLDGFKDALLKGSYRLRVKNKVRSENEIGMSFGAAEEMRLTPVAAGAKSGGSTGKIILGTVIIVAAVAGAAFTGGATIGAALAAGSPIFGITYGAFALFGASVLLAGIAQTLTRTPGVGDLNREKEKPGFLFNGSVTGVEQGGPVPLIFGRVRVGGLVISSGITAERR